jgi:hypothetical protein
VEFRELSKQERLPDFAHSVKVKVEVVVRRQDRAEHFAGNEEMAKVMT